MYHLVTASVCTVCRIERGRRLARFLFFYWISGSKMPWIPTSRKAPGVVQELHGYNALQNVDIVHQHVGAK